MPNPDQATEDFYLQIVEAAAAGGTTSVMKTLARYDGREEEASVESGIVASLTAQSGDAAFHERLTEREAQEIGRALMDLFFSGPIRDLYQQAREKSRGRILRILVSMVERSPLQSLPWELLHDGRKHLAQDKSSFVVRFLRLAQPMAQPEVRPPLNVLVTTACPSGQSLLAVEEEEKIVRNQLANLGVEYRCLRDVSIEELERNYINAKNEGRPYHIWHHCGHGEVDEAGRFRLILHSEGTREPDSVGISQLGKVLAAGPDLRLALVNVCHGASPLGLATHLAELNVPATVGLATQIEDTSALRFIEKFYTALVHTSVEEAVNQARLLMATKNHPYDWSKVLLFSRTSTVSPFLARVRRSNHEGAQGQIHEGKASSHAAAKGVKGVEREEYPDGRIKTRVNEAAELIFNVERG